MDGWLTYFMPVWGGEYRFTCQSNEPIPNLFRNSKKREAEEEEIEREIRRRVNGSKLPDAVNLVCPDLPPDAWITYFMPAYGGEFRETARNSEPFPRLFQNANVRTATQEEINREIRRRSTETR